jgi:hypothetical protein
MRVVKPILSFLALLAILPISPIVACIIYGVVNL